MTHGSPVDQVLLVAFLAGAVLGVARLVARWRARGVAEVDSYLSSHDAGTAHLVMNLGMAVMVTPWWSAGLRIALLVVFGALAAVIAALLARGAWVPTARAGAERPAQLYHLLAAATMVYATALMPVAAADMAGMGGTATAETSVAGPPVLAWVLAVLFALDGLATAVLGLGLPGRVVATSAPVPTGGRGDGGGGGVAAPPRPTTAARRTVRLASVPHLIMDVGMVWMLLML